MAIHTPTDIRFRRAYRKPSRRRRFVARRRLLVRAFIVAVAIGLSVFWSVSALQQSPIFSVSTISVNGNRWISTGEILTLIDSLRGQNIFLADLEIQRSYLQASAWVKEVNLRRILPSTVIVSVTERQPLGVARHGGRLYLVDALGEVVDEYGPRFAEFDFPIIDGLFLGDVSEKNRAEIGRVKLATQLLRQVADREELAVRISQVDVENPRDAVVLLNGDPAFIHLGNERFVERLETYLDLASTLRAHVPKIDYVDLRFDRRVYVRPVGDALLYEEDADRRH